MTSDKEQNKPIKEEPTYDTIAEQLGKKRFKPTSKNHFGINLKENRYRRNK